MSLKEQISTDLKEAMKAKQKPKVAALRMILSELKYAQAAVNAQTELTDDAALKVVASYHKRLTKSLADYPEGDRRTELETEIAIVQTYLPAKASAEEVAKAVDAVLSGATDKNFGALMKQVMAKLGDAADGKTVSQILKEKLA